MPGSIQRAVCSICGLPLPAGELAARCPHCLLTLALEEGANESTSRFAVVNHGVTRPRYFADFELLEKIAEGGMGIVWKARQISIHRIVALKMIHAGHLMSAEARVRFEAEIEATARLDHPNIVPLIETGEYEGVHFFTMKLIASGDLASRRDDFSISGSLDSDESWTRQVRLAGLLVKIARAVHFAHLRGILHRDLKPSNILLDEKGEPYVADFGLAKILTIESGFTFTQSILGSPNYMAPEQATGKTDQLTTATDVYGLGAIFFELLTGKPPFQAESPIATLRKVIENSPERPRNSNRSIDPDLETICLKCLEKSAVSRYASAEALADDLERWLARRPILARRASPLEHVWRWCQREPAQAAAVAACFALLVTVAIGSSIAAIRIRRAEQTATATLRESQISQVRNLRLASEMGHREEALRLLRAASQPGIPEELRPRARDELLSILVRTDLEFLPLRSVSASRDPGLNLVSPGFNRLASLIESNTVVIQSLPEGAELHRFQIHDLEGIRLEQLGHDGRFLGIRAENGISVWDAASGQRVWNTNGSRRAFGFAPDRHEFVVEEFDQRATLLDLPTLTVIKQVMVGTGPPERIQTWNVMALSPERRSLVVARRADRVLIWVDLATGETFRENTNRAPVIALAWSADGSRLAAALSNGRVPVFNPRGGGVFDMPGFFAAARAIALNADGSLLAIQGLDRTLRLVDGEVFRHVFETPCDSGAIAFDRTGERVGPVFRGDEPGWLQLRKPAEFYQANIISTRVDLNDLKFSPDSRLIVAGNVTNIIFCDATDGHRLRSLPRWRMSAFAFDPISNFVYAASTSGLSQWRLKIDDRNRLHLSDMGLVMTGRGWRSFNFNRDGSLFVAANIHSNAAFVFDGSIANPLAILGPHDEPHSVAISPNGQWVATGSPTDRQVRVWNVASRKLERPIPTGDDPRVAFSPDGKWFAAYGDAFTLLATDSWNPAPGLPLPENGSILGSAAFSPDGRILALVCNLSLIQLVDLRTFRSLGVLTSPGRSMIRAIQFSPDGSLLAGTGNVGRLQIWDIRQIRSRLREFALDGDWP
jgi:eukaryotic-like serine/threonine-protein kinase